MPEGHTIHRAARRHRDALGGQPITTGSPQGRFAAGAARLDGRVLETVDAYGKHLFYRWQGDVTLHVHLGLFGKFRLHRADPPPPPSENTRLTMQGGDTTLYLAGPTICELINPEEEEAIRQRLGPDPLGNGGRANRLSRFGSNLERRRVPIGAALLDQKVIAGIGNVYRAEALFLTGISPALPARELGAGTIERLWNTSVDLLQRGERAGRIITVDPADVGAKRRQDLRREQRLYVYGRHGEECRRCGTVISMGEMANRRIWWCDTCQSSDTAA
jgi:DNA-formamidopyrimidine glycosylase